MLIHIDKPHSLVQRHMTELRTMHSTVEPSFANSPRDEDPDGALEQPLKVDHQIVMGVPKDADELHELPQRAKHPAGSQVGEPCLASGDEHTVQRPMAGDELGR